jgi:hypothetical protein
MTTLTVFVGIIAVCNLILLVGLAALAFSLSRVVNKSLNPTLAEVNATVKKVNTLVDKVDDHVEHILEVSETTVRRVSGSVVATTDVVENAIASPFIGMSSLMTGIAKALEAWRRASATTTS